MANITELSYVEYNFNPIIEGSTHEGATLELTKNGSAYDFTGVSVLMHVRSNYDGPIRETITTAGFTISGTTLTLKKRAMTLPHGKYVYDILIKETDNDYKIYYRGTITVLPAVTKPTSLL